MSTIDTEIVNTNVFILVGKSASGKDTLMKDLLKNNPNLTPIITNTTRPIRPSEIQGVEYNFLSEEEFNKYDYIEKREYNTLINGVPSKWQYGVPTSAIKYENNLSYIGILDLQGLYEFKKYVLSQKIGVTFVSMYIDVSDEERTKRAMHRKGFDKTEWDRRLERDTVDFEDAIMECDYVVKNDDYTEALSTIENLIKAYTEILQINSIKFKRK